MEDLHDLIGSGMDLRSIRFEKCDPAKIRHTLQISLKVKSKKIAISSQLAIRPMHIFGMEDEKIILKNDYKYHWIDDWTNDLP